MGGTSTRMPTARTKATTSEVISNLVEQLTTTVNNVNKKTTELLQDGKEFSAYLLNEEEMTGLKIVCEDASTCMQYLRHRINPRTDRKEVCLMPENWRHHDEKNNWNLRERTRPSIGEKKTEWPIKKVSSTSQLTHWNSKANKTCFKPFSIFFTSHGGREHEM